MQKYSLLSTNIDIKGKAYEEIVGANLRGDRGEFFTPRNVMNMVVKMVNPSVDERILDSSCGTGGFLVNALTHVIAKVEKDYSKQIGVPKEQWSSDELRVFRERISEVAANNYFGFDINPDLVKATKMNMVMNNDGSGNILCTNSLLHPHEWTEDFKTTLAAKIGVDKKQIRGPESINFFDIIVTNPPFGSKIPIKDGNILSQYELAHIWDKTPSNHWVMTTKLQSSVPPEILFIERCIQLLKENGRMGIVLPDSILGSPGLGYIREWLIINTRIIASIDLHEDTFQPRNGTQTSILILQKKTKEQKDIEQKTGTYSDYQIFMAIIDKVGHDRRGNPLFKKDPYGNDILEEYEVLDSDGRLSHINKKIDDDQTYELPPLFEKWKIQEGISW